MKLSVEIEGVDNGWIVEDSYFGERTYFKKFQDAEAEAKKRITRIKKYEGIV